MTLLESARTVGTPAVEQFDDQHQNHRDLKRREVGEIAQRDGH